VVTRAIDRPGEGTNRLTTTYVALWIVGLTIGWFEASVVVYLRQIFYPGGFQFPLVAMPLRLLGVEVAREACSLALLAGVAWLAGRRLAERIGAFLLLFGIWDLTYYGVLKFVLDWPAGLGTWDILFLIPVPWASPVWAPVIVAAEFVAAGSYLVWTGDRARAYRATDVIVLLASAATIVATFLAEWRAVADERVPQAFPTWLFWTGVVVGTGWLIRAERRRVLLPPH